MLKISHYKQIQWRSVCPGRFYVSFYQLWKGLTTQAVYVWIFTGSDPLNSSFNYTIFHSLPSTGEKRYMQLHRLESLPPDKTGIASSTLQSLQWVSAVEVFLIWSLWCIKVLVKTQHSCPAISCLSHDISHDGLASCPHSRLTECGVLVFKFYFPELHVQPRLQ